MEQQLIEALAGIKGGKKALKGLIDTAKAELKTEHSEFMRLTQERELHHQRMQQLEDNIELMERLSQREDKE